MNWPIFLINAPPQLNARAFHYSPAVNLLESRFNSGMETVSRRKRSYTAALLVLFQVKTGTELHLFNNVRRQSVRRRLTILQFCQIFVFTLPSLSRVFVARYCRYGFSVTRRLVWSTLNGLFECIFDVGRVKIFCVSSVIQLVAQVRTLVLQGNPTCKNKRAFSY